MEYREEILTLLKAHHLRLTKIRRSLVDVLFQNEAPLSVQDILCKLRKIQLTVNKTTVYRALEQLQNIGIIGVVRLGDRKQYYELAFREHHHHLICLQCERVEDVDMNEDRLFAEEKKVSDERGFTILRHSLEFFGLCRRCQSI
ncbi:MAG: hypothetical protein COZ29_01645 [Candidatus Moranbacteria bacterium CG_4_10_14_3_um_filter_45_9]|nr:MAG: hypothetical protein AUK19_03600 [Candidatus Moranbacteria bacterium CG2_30_45_14]PIX90120.1 MAG: hypothetical protein COZ29_01645 [Candidatus Moranbacteria bacterium CG_4_10_14_3_um_filter_45_9]PJA85009.1 MAG: hypothetical protein CO143_03415 [Candidatus Moranbacteria bacterium CG_4_9_14_3_um_filter_45_14]